MKPHNNRFIAGHYRKSPQETLSNIAKNMSPNVKADIYGTGIHINNFEKKIANLLGKESAVFIPSGTMAQPIALRIWSERKNNKNFAFHSKSHLELHEHKAYHFLHNLRGIYLGAPNRLITEEDLEKFPSSISSLLIELPQREIGGQLPSWKELQGLTQKAREKNIALHLDGARLWECQPFYQKSYSEICSLFDTVYVSFYKGLGGITGAILAGESSFIDEAIIWKRRQGGDLIHLYPYVLSAEQALDQRLHLMKNYHKKATSIASILNEIEGIETLPKFPPTNMMHVYLKGDIELLEQRASTIAEKSKIVLFRKLSLADVPGYCKFELSVGDASLDITDRELKETFQQLMNVT